MLSIPKNTCSEGHEVRFLCTDEECTHPSFICDSSSCQTSVNHSHCINRAEITRLITNLVNKGLSTSKVNDPILQFYTKTIKTLSRDQEDYLNTKNQPGFLLEGDQKNLYVLLTEGPISQIQSKLTLNVSKSLRHQPYILPKKQLLLLKNQTQALQRQVQLISKQITLNWEHSQQQNINSQLSQIKYDYIFSKQSLKNDTIEILANCKVAKNTKQMQQKSNPTKSLGFIVVQPSLEVQTSIKRLQIKINKITDFVSLSICHKNYKSNGELKWSMDLRQIILLVSSNSKLLNKVKSNKTKVICENGDVFQIQYNPKSYSLVIMNQTRNLKQTVSLTHLKQAITPIYLCLMMHNQLETEIEILSDQC